MDIKKDLLIYVVEDNKIYNRLVCEFLKKQNFTNVKSFLLGKECVKEVVKGARPHIVIQDYFMGDSNGIDVLVNVKKHSKDSEFLFLTANEDMEVAVNSIKYGAYDYIIKDNDLALQKVQIKIGKISRIIELDKKNKLIKQAMIIAVLVLVIIVLFALLHIVFDAFGLKT